MPPVSASRELVYGLLYWAGQDASLDGLTLT